MSEKRIQSVAEHFNSEADVFDARVVKIIPGYRDMLESLVANLPFPPGKHIRVIDLGCGTGTLSLLVKQRFPQAVIRCVDFSPRMLELAARKLSGCSHLAFEQADLQTYLFRESYDAVVTSLALHHLETNWDKEKVHRRIFHALNPGGVFASADLTASADKRIQRSYLRKWEEFILQSYSRPEVKQNYRRYKREDRPSVLLEELGWLKKIGFRHLEIYWKYCNFASYGAYK